jgi:histidine triad (HIT) family protein
VYNIGIMDDIFEKIIAREIPASIIYEDDDVISFLDIKPVNKGHALIVPKKKFRNLLDADPVSLQKMVAVAHKVAIALQKAVGADGINLTMNNERAGGQDVFHAHMHVIPRFLGDEAFKHAKHTIYEEGEMAEIATTIKKVLGE